MRTFIRVVLVLASMSMVAGNWHGHGASHVCALGASSLFLFANVMALVWGWVGR